jgi:hypothetical protein
LKNLIEIDSEDFPTYSEFVKDSKVSISEFYAVVADYASDSNLASRFFIISILEEKMNEKKYVDELDLN